LLKYGGNELETGFPLVRKAIPKHNLHAVGENANSFSAFFSKILSLRGKEGRFASRFAGGAHQRASVASLSLGDRFNLPRNAHGICF